MNRPFSFALLVVTVIAAAALPTHAQEWTRFRGPNGTGMSDTAFPPQWTQKDYAWTVELPGGGHSSPVVWGNKVVVTCASDTTAERMVVCVDAKSGKILWKKEYGSHTFHQHGDNSYASSTPTVDADHVYVCWITPEEFTLVALTHDGVESWKTELGGFISQHGGGNSPIILGDTILLGGEQEAPGASYLFAIDRATGKLRWKTARKTLKFSAATPVVFHPKSGADQVVFTSQGEGMTGVDPASGKVLWQASDLFGWRTVGSPISGDGLLFGTCGEGAGGHLLVAIRPGDDGSAKVVWKVKDETPYVPTPIIKGDLLYYWADRGVVTCAKAATGQILWHEHVPGSYYSSPVCAGSTLFNVTKQGEVVAIAAGEKFQLLGQTPLNEKCHATPAISGGLMFVRTYTHLWCVKSVSTQARAE